MRARQNKLLDKVERFIASLFEAPFRALPSQLEPLDIERELKQEMDKARTPSGGRLVVPTAYDIFVSIADHQFLTPNQGLLIKNWQNSMIEYARERQYFLPDMPILRLHGKSDIKNGRVYIKPAPEDDQVGKTQVLDEEALKRLLQSQQATHVAGGTPQQHSPHFAAQPVPAAPHAQLVIRLPQGNQRVYPLDKPVLSIGRQLDNDIIVEDRRVGRYHAQLKMEPNGYVLYDLGSTNGTTLNRVAVVSPHVLQPGDIFTIGNYDFHFVLS